MRIIKKGVNRSELGAYNHASPVVVQCVRCGAPFRTRQSTRKYCSDDCSRAARREKEAARKRAKRRAENEAAGIVHCRVCGRPLRDPASIILGAGPECLRRRLAPGS